MTRRYTSGFDILGFDTDPTPGDPDVILQQIVPAYTQIGDDSETALTALKSNAIQSGSGQTMQALQKLIGTSYPPKLQQAADSYHSAASIYTTYANALAEAQNQLDRWTRPPRSQPWRTPRCPRLRRTPPPTRSARSSSSSRAWTRLTSS